MVKKKTNVVIILGAGCTLDNADNVNEYEKPPLDKGFFQTIKDFLEKASLNYHKRKDLLKEFEYVRSYFEILYGVDICSGDEDSLEKVTSKLYSDIIENSPEGKPAFSVFISLLRLFCDILGETTNKMGTGNDKKLYKIINSYLKKGIKPEKVTIISFNYDIYVERVLAQLALSYRKPDLITFLIQCSYELNLPLTDFTRPPKPRMGYFPIIPGIRKGGIRVLKLHGSLNWYSYYPKKPGDLQKMYEVHRVLKVSGEKEISSGMLKYQSQQGSLYGTLPIIIPPIQTKSGIFHSKIRGLWGHAKRALKNADELIIYGYSCPPFDEDSEKLLHDSIGENQRIKTISIINPNSATCDRYIRLFRPKRVLWYQHSAYFG